MTQTALELNSPKIGQAHSTWKTTLELSKHDCVVLKFTSGPDRPSLLLDKPLRCIESRITKHGDKTFESGEFMGCRVYWEIAEVPA